MQKAQRRRRIQTRAQRRSRALRRAARAGDCRPTGKIVPQLSDGRQSSGAASDHETAP